MNITQKQIELLKFVDKNISLAENRLSVFKNYAYIKELSYKSVRNDYYKLVKGLKKEDYVNLGLNFENHIINKNNHFTKMEMDKEIKKILYLYKQGNSLYGSCLKIANNDKSLAIRYQNKIRKMNLHKQNDDKIIYFKPNNANDSKKDANAKILSLPNQSKGLSEQDINALFLGLVRLVKRTSEAQIKQQVKKEFDNANNILQQTLEELNTVNKRNLHLTRENNLLKQNLNLVNEKLYDKTTNYNQKIESLRQILIKLKSNISV